MHAALLKFTLPKLQYNKSCVVTIHSSTVGTAAACSNSCMDRDIRMDECSSCKLYISTIASHSACLQYVMLCRCGNLLKCAMLCVFMCMSMNVCVCVCLCTCCSLALITYMHVYSDDFPPKLQTATRWINGAMHTDNLDDTKVKQE